MDGRLLWQTLYHADRNRTEVQLSHYFTTPRGSISTAPINQFSLHNSMDQWDASQWEETEPEGIYAVWKELSEQSRQAGTQVEQPVRLADYYAFYPLNGYVSFAQTLIEWDWRYPDEASQARQAMNDYFRIPVLENQYLLLSAFVREGSFSHYNSAPFQDKPEYDWFDLNASYVMTEDAVYFTFGNRTWKGSTVDTSLIPGGYGIYCLPLSTDSQGQPTALFDNLSTLYSMDPSHEALSLHISKDERFLYLFSQQEEQSPVTLTVLDLHNPEADPQIISIPESEGTQGGPSQVYVRRDHLLTVWQSTRLCLISRDEDGIHHPEFTTQPVERSYSEGQLTFDLYSYGYLRHAAPSYQWDGETLAVVLSAPSPGVEPYHSQTASFDLVIFNREGLQYFGHYESSLNSQTFQHTVYPWGAPALALYRY